MTTQQPVWIIGGYQSDFARNFSKESLEISDLVRETTTGTLAHAGIPTAQIEVIHVANAMGEFYVKQGHLGSMVATVVPELAGLPASRHEAACASGSVAVLAAMADLESGRYDVALVLGGEIERNVSELARNLSTRYGSKWLPDSALMVSTVCSWVYATLYVRRILKAS